VFAILVVEHQGRERHIQYQLFCLLNKKPKKLDTHTVTHTHERGESVFLPLPTVHFLSLAVWRRTDTDGRLLPTINVHVIALPVSVDSSSTTRLKTNISARFLCVSPCFVSTIHGSSSSSHKRQWRRKERLYTLLAGRLIVFCFVLLNEKYHHHRSTGEVETLTHLVFLALRTNIRSV
jgi:hypothetical protein